MNKRTRKKWLKKHNVDVNPRETWDLCDRISEYIIPRLKLFKKLNNGYPGRDDMDTPEKWDEALDKMITAFQLTLDMSKMSDKYWQPQHNPQLWEEDLQKIDEGMALFGKWFQQLWW